MRWRLRYEARSRICSTRPRIWADVSMGKRQLVHAGSGESPGVATLLGVTAVVSSAIIKQLMTLSAIAARRIVQLEDRAPARAECDSLLLKQPVCAIERPTWPPRRRIAALNSEVVTNGPVGLGMTVNAWASASVAETAVSELATQAARAFGASGELHTAQSYQRRAAKPMPVREQRPLRPEILR